MNLQFLISLFISFALVVGGANTAFASIAPGTDVGSAEHSIKGSDGFSVSLMVKPERNGLAKIGKRIYFYKNGKKFKGWKTVKGKRYYFKSNGRAATGSYKIKKKYYIFDSTGALVKAKKSIKIAKVGKSRYLVDSKGIAVKGWKVLSGKLYYAFSSGKCAANKTVDKVPFNSSGYAKPKNDRTKLLIEAMAIVSRLTNDDMTRLEKLEKCWNYVNSFRYRLSQRPPNHNKGWQIPWAYSSLKIKIVNCNGIACGFSALAKVLGEDPYLVLEHNYGHMWVTLNGKHWDSDLDIQDGDHAHHPDTNATKTRFW